MSKYDDPTAHPLQRRDPEAARERDASSAASTSRRPVRRLPGLCLYCGRPLYSHRRLACTAHRDLLAVDPLVNRAHLVLSEAELLRATNRKEVPNDDR